MSENVVSAIICDTQDNRTGKGKKLFFSEFPFPVASMML